MTFPTLFERTMLTLLILLGTLSVGACGNKGPLYIPPPPIELESLPAEHEAPDQEAPGQDEQPTS